MRCLVHDERYTNNTCSCSEIVKELRQLAADADDKISREERYFENQGHTVAERSYRAGWNDAMKRAAELIASLTRAS